jgi:hypothetical protein
VPASSKERKEASELAAGASAIEEGKQPAEYGKQGKPKK